MSIITNIIDELNKSKAELESLGNPRELGKASHIRYEQLVQRIWEKTRTISNIGKSYLFRVEGKMLQGVIEVPFKVELSLVNDIPLPELQTLIELKLKFQFNNIKDIWFESIDRRELGVISFDD